MGNNYAERRKQAAINLQATGKNRTRRKHVIWEALKMKAELMIYVVSFLEQRKKWKGTVLISVVSLYVGEILKMLYEFLIGFMSASSRMIEISLKLKVKTMLTVMAGTALLGWSGDKCFQAYEEDYTTNSINHR